MSKLILPKWETPTPAGVAGSYGQQIRAWGKRVRGRVYGPWQVYVIDQLGRCDSAGDLIARIVLLGVGRQNGKTVIVEDIIGWMLDEGRHLPPFQGWTEMLAAAHDAPQARKMYNRVRVGIENSEATNRIKTTQWAGISAGTLDFNTVTGQPGSARGSAAGLIAWDEVLTQRTFDMWAALGPTQSAQRSPLMLLTSTAGTAESVLLRSFHDRLVRMATGDEAPDPRFYGAWWASDDPDAAADTAQTGAPITRAEWVEVRKANPASQDGRLTDEAIQLDHSILPPDDWRRERLNHFVDATVPGAFAPGVWARCREVSPLRGLAGPFALAVDVQPGGDRATISFAGIRGDGRVGVGVVKEITKDATAAVIVAAVAEFDRGPVVSIEYDGVLGHASDFRRDAETSGRPWHEMKAHEVVRACMDVTEMILSGRLAVDDPLYDHQIGGTARRSVGQDGAFRFSRVESAGPIDAVMSMTLAAHVIANPAKRVQIFF